MSKKPYRINGKDVVVKAENAVYGGNIENVDNAQDAIDNLDERVVELEENSGGGSVVVEGSAAPLTDNDKNAFNLKRVFEKPNFAAATGWEIRCENYVSDGLVNLVNGAMFTLVVEVQAGSTSLGANAISNLSMSLNYRTNFNGYTWSHKWDGEKDIYTITAPIGHNNPSTNAAFGVFGFAIHGADGKDVKIASYFTAAGTTFYCKKCYYSATSSTDAMSSLSYRLEWPESATTADKITALIDNHQLPFCSAGSEYNPFLTVNTTPRVIVTIVSDDGEIHDYTHMRPYFQSVAEQYGVDIRWSVALPSNMITYKESIRIGNLSTNSGERMTASMVRDLVANYGVSVLCHNYDHEVFNNLSQAETEAVITNAKRQIERKIGVPCIHHCLPGGGYNNYCWAEIAKQFISTATITAGINTHDSDRFKIFRVCLTRISGESASEVSPSRLQYILDAQNYVTTNNKSAWVIYYTHGQEWSVNEVNLKGITEYCLENGIAMLNYSEAYAEMYPPIDRLKTLLGI